MYSKVTTTITTTVDLETFETEHEVHVDAGDGLPKQVVVAAAIGGVKSTLKALEAQS